MQIDRTSRLFRVGAALWLGLAVVLAIVGGRALAVTPTAAPTAAVTAPAAPAAPAHVTTPAAAGHVTTPAALAVTTVYECTTTGRWYATKSICQANCAGGTCFACGLGCQN